MISSSTAAEVARGVSRLLLLRGFAPILEFCLPNGRRLHVAAIGPDGKYWRGDQGGAGRSALRHQMAGLSGLLRSVRFRHSAGFSARVCAAPDRVDGGRPLWRRDRQTGGSADTACVTAQGGDDQLRQCCGDPALGHSRDRDAIHHGQSCGPGLGAKLS